MTTSAAASSSPEGKVSERFGVVKDLKPGAALLLPCSRDSPTCRSEKPIITRASISSLHFLSLYTEGIGRSVSLALA